LPFLANVGADLSPLGEAMRQRSRGGSQHLIANASSVALFTPSTPSISRDVRAWS